MKLSRLPVKSINTALIISALCLLLLLIVRSSVTVNLLRSLGALSVVAALAVALVALLLGKIAGGLRLIPLIIPVLLLANVALYAAILLLPMTSAVPASSADVPAARILIARFEAPGAAGSFPVADDWRTAIEEKAAALQLGRSGVNVQVQTLDTPISSREQALTLSHDNGAALVIWGSAQLGSIDAQFLVNPRWCVHCAISPVTISECTPDALAQLVIPPDEKEYALTFLLGLLLYYTDHVDTALTLFNEAARTGAVTQSADALNLASLYLYRGSALQEGGRLGDAMRSYDRALELRPDFVCVRAQRAVLLDAWQLHDEALNEYNTVLTASANADWAYRARAGGYRALEQYDAAMNDLNSAAQLDANDPANAYWRGATYYDLRDYPAAVTQFNEALRLAPENANAFAWRAAAYREQGQIDAAVTDLVEALRLAPGVAAYHSSLGDLFYGQGRIDEAISDKSRAIALAPDVARYYTDLGGIYYFSLRDYATAVEIYTQALYADANNVTAYYYRGMSNYELQRIEAALSDFEAAVALDPGSADYYNWRGRMRSDLGLYDDAILDFSEAIRLQPEVASHYSLLGDVYFALGRYQEAVDSETQAIGLDPNNPRRYTDLAGIYLFALNDYEMAVSIYSRALQADPQDAVALFYRGRAHFEAGRVNEARTDIQAAFQIEPNNASFQEWLNANYQALGLTQPGF